MMAPTLVVIATGLGALTLLTEKMQGEAMLLITPHL